MAYISNIGVHPVKTLDRVHIDEARITEGGTLEYDRLYALSKSNDELIKGLKYDSLIRLDSIFDLKTETLTVCPKEGSKEQFNLREDVSEAGNWFSDFLSTDVTIKRDASTGFVSRPKAGPSVISTATLEEVASWFDNITPSEIRRRMRVNIEIGGVPPFWEDQFVGKNKSIFKINDIRFEGVEPCERCIIPMRDPSTGDLTKEFREKFLENRERTFPEWADSNAFEHYFYLMLIASVLKEDRGKTIQVGDDVTVLDDSESVPDLGQNSGHGTI